MRHSAWKCKYLLCPQIVHTQFLAHLPPPSSSSSSFSWKFMWILLEWECRQIKFIVFCFGTRCKGTGMSGKSNIFIIKSIGFPLMTDVEAFGCVLRSLWRNLLEIHRISAGIQVKKSFQEFKFNLTVNFCWKFNLGFKNSN